jgi:hypothetical protein
MKCYSLRARTVTQVSLFGRNVFGQNRILAEYVWAKCQGIAKRADSNPNHFESKSQQPHQNSRAILPAPTAKPCCFPTFPCFLRYVTSESNNNELSILINVKKSLTLKLCVCVTSSRTLLTLSGERATVRFRQVAPRLWCF